MKPNTIVGAALITSAVVIALVIPAESKRVWNTSWGAQ
jgi:hypothetical protein